jgi:short subunit dehydrogenase-like uncharacterized protein
MPIQSWMIYGAYGYSGRLIAERAAEKGLNPVLAGRDPAKTRAVAEEFGFEPRVFDLRDTHRIAQNLLDIDAVVHCAGPFSATSAPMLGGCIAGKAHYFDITGEIAVFEHAHSPRVDAAARAAGIIVCPGVGFDVVPTDCMARTLADALLGATTLSLGFHGSMNMSPGTARTIIESLGHGTMGRRGGRVVEIPLEVREIDFGRGVRRSMSVSWGDVSTAYYTTGIENITVYWPASDATIRKLRFAWLARPLLRQAWLQRRIKREIDRKVRGPSPEQREQQSVHVWGEVSDHSGRTVTGRMTTANGYTVTQLAPVAIVEHLLLHDAAAGSTTPALLMGRDFASRLPGSSDIVLS